MRGALSIFTSCKVFTSTGMALLYLVLGCELRAQATDELANTGTQFAPGVLTTISPQLDPADTVSRHDVVELRAMDHLERTPNLLSETRTVFDKAENAVFRHNIWGLEFTFKPLRMMAIDIPQPSGKVQRKLVWYLVYRVRNTGAGLASQKQEDGTYTTVEQSMGPQRFVPKFMLTSLDLDRQGDPILKSYMDRIMPAAVAEIARRELPRGELLNNVEISEKLLEPETGRSVGGLWGVATWEDVDPEIDFFAIFVSGLTNAYRWEDVADFEAGAAPGTGRTLTRKVLQLNFWRPGDSYQENETEIRYGSAPGMSKLYGTLEGIAHQWVYR